MSTDLQKQIITRVKKIKCQQPQCKSQNQETLQVAIVGNNQTKKNGIMCVSCFIDQQLIDQIGNVQMYSLSIQKFVKSLTSNYKKYAKQKQDKAWPPLLIDHKGRQIKNEVQNIQKIVMKGILNIMKNLEDNFKTTIQELKKVNNNKSFDKIVEVINQQNQEQQQKINISNQIKDVVPKIIYENGQYKLQTQQNIDKKNIEMLNQFKKKSIKAKETIINLSQVLKKLIKSIQ